MKSSSNHLKSNPNLVIKNQLKLEKCKNDRKRRDELVQSFRNSNLQKPVVDLNIKSNEKCDYKSFFFYKFKLN